MSQHVDHYNKQILSHLSTEGGYTTGDIADKCVPIFGGNKSMHSAFIRIRLLDLQRQGKVRPMDDQKPVCWVLAKEKT